MIGWECTKETKAGKYSFNSATQNFPPIPVNPISSFQLASQNRLAVLEQAQCVVQYGDVTKNLFLSVTNFVTV